MSLPLEEEQQLSLSNRGNKLSGEENPGSVRPKLWSNKQKLGGSDCCNTIEADDFEVKTHTHNISCYSYSYSYFLILTFPT